LPVLSLAADPASSPLMIQGPTETGPVPRTVVDFGDHGTWPQMASEPAGVVAERIRLRDRLRDRRCFARLRSYRFFFRNWIACHCCRQSCDGSDGKCTRTFREWLFYRSADPYYLHPCCHPVYPCCDPPLYTFFLDPNCGDGTCHQPATCHQPPAEPAPETDSARTLTMRGGRVLNLLSRLKRDRAAFPTGEDFYDSAPPTPDQP
jgi:hypothetical protein